MDVLLSAADRLQLLSNGHQTAGGDQIDPPPVVRLFIPGYFAQWYLTELDPDDEDEAFGLCDLGVGHPKLQHVRLSELSSLASKLGSQVTRDAAFETTLPISKFARRCHFDAYAKRCGGETTKGTENYN